MGAQASTEGLEENAFISALRSPGVPNDQVPWESFGGVPLCYPAALSNEALRTELAGVVADVVAHTGVTHRLGVLLKKIGDKVGQWASNKPEQVPYTMLCNYLLWLQFLLVEAMKTAEGDRLRLHDLCAITTPKADDGVRYTIDALVGFMCKHPVASQQGCLSAHSIAVACLTVVCASPVFTSPTEASEPAACDMPFPEQVLPPPSPASSSGIEYVCNHSDSTAVLTALFKHIEQASFDHCEAANDTISLEKKAPSWLSLIDWITYYRPSAALTRRAVNSGKALSTDLGRRAALLLCTLLYQGKNRSKHAPHALLVAFRDVTNGSVPDITVFTVFNAFCRPAALENPEMVLLLYTLCIENAAFLEHVVRSAEVGRLVIPMCRLLANVEALWEMPASLYVLMSTLLILSQQRGFAANVHLEAEPCVDWCKEMGRLKDITSGSLLLLMLARIVQHNVAKGMDVYVSKQALSIISNLGGDVRNVHVAAAQKLVLLTVFLGRKLQKAPDEEAVETYSDFLVNVMGCMALTLSVSITDNLPLVYELLHTHDKLTAMPLPPLPPPPVPTYASPAAPPAERDAFGDTLETLHALRGALLMLLEYFSSALNADQHASLNTVEATTQALEVAALSWDSAGFNFPVPDRYAFAEEPCPEAFFVPHAWDLVVHHYPSFGWDVPNLPLFSCKALTSPRSASGHGQEAPATPMQHDAGPQQV
eukprot:TRINITY_DN16651_c0_g1_i1.p1 TRINITY_DN16651_c0_g1~~TRINITY_DN16651_c0_g1_i1.p1  ORF type:complete len:723 (+),score=200.23 TRINITY_DN16651_c0_g1_i1:43-2169(+)